MAQQSTWNLDDTRMMLYEIVVCGARGRLTAMLGIPNDPDAAWGFCDNVPDDLTERLL